MIEKNGFNHHPTSEISEGATIGEGSKIWNQAQIRENVTIGKNCTIGKNNYIDHDVVIGNNVKIQNNVSVWYGVTIEDNVLVGPSVVFTNDLFPRAHEWDESRIQKTTVKEGASIGANATIMCGHGVDRIIGRFAMIGGGSVVTKDVSDYSLVVGNPAKHIGYACECGYPLKEGATCKKCSLSLKDGKIV